MHPHAMDAVFALPQTPRAHFLSSLLQSLGCTYVCLWQYHSNLSNRLYFFDGFYHVLNNQPSSSSATQAATLFHQYRALTFDVNDDCVPGLAFRNHLPYIELQLLDLLKLTSTEIQKQFFQIGVFMGCKMGEIELGFSNMSQVDIQTALKNLFPEDFYIHSQSIDQNPHSSTSSFISLSTASPNQCSSLSINIPDTSHSNFPEALGVATTQPSSHKQRVHALSQVIPSYLNLPTPEGEHEEIVRALIQVISSPSQQHQPNQNLPHTSVIHPRATAFTRNRPDMTNPNIKPLMESNFCRQNHQNRSFAFFENLNSMRIRAQNTIQARHPIITQQHYFHMISERRRREKLKANFQALRALLPLGTKKNRTTILTTAKETLRSLMTDIEKLNMRNQQQLMTDLSGKEGSNSEEMRGRSSNERLNVRVWHVSESSSSSEEQMVNLQVRVRGSSQIDVSIRILEFLERVQNVTLISTKANNYITEGGTTINELTFRLRIIKGSEWDESNFEEAIRRVVCDVIHCQLHH